MVIRTALKKVIAASQNLVSTDEAKTHLQVDFADATQNTYIDMLCSSAQEQVEQFTNRRLTEVVYDFYLTAFPTGGIVLPFSPVSSITSIKYYDSAGVEQTLSTADYIYSVSEEPCRIIPDDTWPGTDDDRFDAVTVRFTTGYTSPETCPDNLKNAILLLLRKLYDNREGGVSERFETWQLLCYPSRVFHSTVENT